MYCSYNQMTCPLISVRETMKTILFFNLISFGIVLVLSQTSQPFSAPFTPDCKLTKAGREYAGPLNVTRSGVTCQRWTSDQPHFNYFKETTLYPEGSAQAAGNKCRNPDSNYNVGVWCYTTSPRLRWDHCDVTFCECRLPSDILGIRYEGQIRYTRSGRQCKSWSIQTPQIHPFNESIYYPDASVAEARNYCRNPNASRPDGPWCFTNDPNIEWEYCLIPVCNFTSPVFSNMSQTSPTSSQTSPRQTRTPTQGNIPSSAVNTLPSPTNPSTIPVSTPSLPRTTTTSTTSLRTYPIRTTPSTTRISSPTKLVTRAMPTQLPQDSTTPRENEPMNIVKVVIPTVGVIAVICIIAAILVWKRTGICQSSWKRFVDRRNSPNAERAKQATVAVDSTSNQDSFDNPVYAKDQQPKEIAGVTKDHSSTDYVTIKDSGVAYMSMDNVRLS